MLEQKIYNHLIGQEQITSLLATYSGLPAVFLQEAPADADSGWDGEQYGRLVFGIDYAGDAEREISATVWVRFAGLANDPALEKITPILGDNLDNRFFADGEEIIALSWHNSQNFEETKNDKAVRGVTLTFDMFYFPAQLTTDPDPVEAINTWTKEQLQHVSVIGLDALPDSWTPEEIPAVYWHITEMKPSSLYPGTYACAWYDVDLMGHFMMDAPNTNTQLSVCKEFIDVLEALGKVIMLDGSPMFIQSVSYKATPDVIKTGQITATVTYGVLRKIPQVGKLNVIHTQEE